MRHAYNAIIILFLVFIIGLSIYGLTNLIKPGQTSYHCDYIKQCISETDKNPYKQIELKSGEPSATGYLPPILIANDISLIYNSWFWFLVLILSISLVFLKVFINEYAKYLFECINPPKKNKSNTT